MKQNNIYFQNIDSKNIDSLFLELIDSKCEISAAPNESGEKVIRIMPVKYEGKKLICKPVNDINLKKSERLILQFTINSKVFMTLSTYENNNQSLTLNFDDDIFKIERREENRIKISDNQNCKTTLFSNDIEYNVSISDLSPGGCQLKLNEPLAINSNEIYTIEISTEHHFLFKTKASSRYISPDKKTIGFSFLDLDDSAKIKITGVMIDLFTQGFTE